MGNAVKGGFSCLFRNKWYSLASVLTVSVCIFLFGMFYTILADLQETLAAAREEVQVAVFFEEGTTEEEILSFKGKLEKREEVAGVDYTSADEAWASFSQSYLGDGGESFETNPLKDSASLQIYMKDLGAQGDLVAWLENQSLVRSVKYSDAAAETLFGAGNLLARPGFLALEDLAHLVFDGGVVVLADVVIQLEVVVKAVVHLRADSILHVLAPKLDHGLCQHVGQRMSVDC